MNWMRTCRITALLCLMVFGGCGSSNNVSVSGEGEACTKTSDCRSGLKCRDATCHNESPSEDVVVGDSQDLLDAKATPELIDVSLATDVLLLDGIKEVGDEVASGDVQWKEAGDVGSWEDAKDIHADLDSSEVAGTWEIVGATMCWDRTYGGSQEDEGRAVQQTTDGGYIMAGLTESGVVGKSDAWVVKVDSAGGIEWDAKYGGPGWDLANSVQQTAAGGYVVAGYTENDATDSSDAFVVKLAGSGSVEWSKAFDRIGKSDWAESIQQTSDGGYIVAGLTTSDSGADDNMWVLKLDPNGEVEWDSVQGEDGDDTASSVRQTIDGGYIVAGSKGNIDTGESDAWLLKLKNDGSIEWDATYGGSYSHDAISVRQTTDAGYVVAGETLLTGFSGSDLWVLKVDLQGEVEWDKSYGGANDDIGWSVKQTVTGSYVVVGSTKKEVAGSWDRDLWVLWLNDEGNIEWDVTYGGSSDDAGYFIQQTSDHHYLVAGYTKSKGAGNNDVWIMKIATNDSNCD